MTSSIDVILVNYKASQKTISCIRSLEQQSLLPHSIIIIDNATSSESISEFKNAFGDNLNQSKISLFWIWNKKNLGFAAAVNQGIQYIESNFKYDFIWILNNDTEPQINALQELFTKAKETGAAITGSAIYKIDGTFSGGVGKIHPWFASVRRAKSLDCTEFDYVEGSSFFLSSDCIKKLGFICEDYFLYFEETDYCTRAKRAGLKFAWATKSIVYHDIGSSTLSERKKEIPITIDSLMVRNRILFAKKFGFPKLGYYIGLLISIFLRIRRKQFKHIPLILKLIFLKNYFEKFLERLR